jgi:hypothetical protein
LSPKGRRFRLAARLTELTEAIKTKQQLPELVFPGEHAFDRPKSLFKYGYLKQRLAASGGYRVLLPARCAAILLVRSKPKSDQGGTESLIIPLAAHQVRLV